MSKKPTITLGEAMDRFKIFCKTANMCNGGSKHQMAKNWEITNNGMMERMENHCLKCGRPFFFWGDGRTSEEYFDKQMDKYR